MPARSSAGIGGRSPDGIFARHGIPSAMMLYPQASLPGGTCRPRGEWQGHQRTGKGARLGGPTCMPWGTLAREQSSLLPKACPSLTSICLCYVCLLTGHWR